MSPPIALHNRSNAKPQQASERMASLAHQTLILETIVSLVRQTLILIRETIASLVRQTLTLILERIASLAH